MQDKKKKGTLGNFSAFYPIAAMFFVVGIVKASIIFISGALFFLICAIDETKAQKKASEVQDEVSRETGLSNPGPPDQGAQSNLKVAQHHLSTPLVCWPWA